MNLLPPLWLSFSLEEKRVFIEVVTFQDLQRSIMDPGRVLQHEGRHPERDDRSAQVPGRGTRCKDNNHLAINFISKKKLYVPFAQIPIVENEIKKETGEVKPEDEVSAAPAQKLVTEMGTYVTQSALSSSRPSKKEEDR